MAETAVAEPVAALPEKPAPKSEKELVGLWHERIRIARKAQEDWARKSGADRFIEEYNGVFKGLVFHTGGSSVDIPPINEVFSYCQADLSNTYNRDPHISVNPKAGTVKGAKLWEQIVNYYWRKLKSKDELEPEIIEKNLVGYAWHKVGTETTSQSTIVLDVEPSGLYSRRVNWRDLVWNLGAKNPPVDCLWMAQRIVLPLQEVKRRFPVASKLQGTMSPDVDKNTYESAAYKDDISVAVLWEVWDKMDNQVLLLAEGFPDRFLDVPRPWPEHLRLMGEYPFLMYWDYFSPDSPRPMSAIAPWEAQMKEKMILLGTAVLHSKRWNRQMIVAKGSIDSASLDKFVRGDDGAVIENTGIGGLNQNVMFTDFGALPTDFYLLMDRLSAIERETNGQPEFERGGVTKTNTRTKGELSLIQQGAQGRSSRKIDRFETHIENIARHMLAELKADFDFESAVQITGQLPDDVIAELGENYDPVTGIVTFTPDEIAGEYDVEVKAGSTLPLNEEGKVEALNSILDALARVPQGGVSPFINAIITEILDRYQMKSLQQAYAEEREMIERQKQMEEQEVDATEAKARSQAAKNIAQTDKIGAEADKIRLETPQSPEQMRIQEENMTSSENGLESGGF